jgi:hypothetical protein
MSEPEEKSSFEPIIVVGVVVACLIGFFAYALLAPNFIGGHGSPANTCINNLRWIDAAKNQWASENRKTNGAVVLENDIKPYLKLDSKGNLPKCPSGGTYTIGKVGEPPTCSLGTTINPPHVLP